MPFKQNRLALSKSKEELLIYKVRKESCFSMQPANYRDAFNKRMKRAITCIIPNNFTKYALIFKAVQFNTIWVYIIILLKKQTGGYLFSTKYC